MSQGASVADRETRSAADQSAGGLRRVRTGESMFRLVWSRFRRHRLATVSLLVLAVLALVAIAAPLFVAEEDANRLVVTSILEPPSATYPFGTDDVGRDVLLRSIFGARISLLIGFLAALLSVTIGVAVGALSGYHQGWIDNILMRITDALLSIPTLFILIVLTRVAGQSVGVITVVIGVLSWMGVSRLVRANVLTLKQQDFVLAAQSIGVQPRAILVRHILPNTIAPIVVAATLGVGQAIILEASLSFLGLGVQPPTATWGSMLYRAQSFLVTAPWVAFFPGILILITVLCVNFIGDGLRDALDPRALS